MKTSSVYRTIARKLNTGRLAKDRCSSPLRIRGFTNKSFNSSEVTQSNRVPAVQVQFSSNFGEPLGSSCLNVSTPVLSPTQDI